MATTPRTRRAGPVAVPASGLSSTHSDGGSVGSGGELARAAAGCKWSVRLVLAISCGLLVMVLGFAQIALVVPLHDELVERARSVVNTSSTEAKLAISAVVSEMAVGVPVIVSHALLLTGGNATLLMPPEDAAQRNATDSPPCWDHSWQRAFSVVGPASRHHRFAFLARDSSAESAEAIIGGALDRRVVTNTATGKTFTFAAANRTDSAKTELKAVSRTVESRLVDCEPVMDAVRQIVDGGSPLPDIGVDPRENVIKAMFVEGACVVHGVPVALWLFPVFLHHLGAGGALSRIFVGSVVGMIPLASVLRPHIDRASSAIADVTRKRHSPATILQQRIAVVDAASLSLVASDLPNYAITFEASEGVVGRTCVPLSPTLCRVHMTDLDGGMAAFGALARTHPALLATDPGHVRTPQRVEVRGVSSVVVAHPLHFETSSAQWLVVFIAPLTSVVGDYAASLRDAVVTTVLVMLACTIVVGLFVLTATSPLHSIAAEMRLTTNRFRCAPSSSARPMTSLVEEVGAIQETVGELSAVLAQLRGFLPGGVIEENALQLQRRQRKGANWHHQRQQPRGETVELEEEDEEEMRRVELARRREVGEALFPPGNDGNSSAAVLNVSPPISPLVGDDAVAAVASAKGTRKQHRHPRRAAFILIDLGSVMVREMGEVERLRALHEFLLFTIETHRGCVERADAGAVWASFDCHVPCPQPLEAACRCAVDIALELDRCAGSAADRFNDGALVAADAVVCVDTFVPSVVNVAAANLKSRFIDSARAAAMFALPPLARLHGVRAVITGDVQASCVFEAVVLDAVEYPADEGVARIFELRAVPKELAMLSEVAVATARRAFSHMLNGQYAAAAAVWPDVEGAHARHMERLCRALHKRTITRQYRRDRASTWEVEDRCMCDDETPAQN